MISKKAERMVDEAKKYRELCGDKCDFYAKIPITVEGYKAIPMLKRAGIKVTATAIFTHQQALVAARAGANFVAPYVNRLDNISCAHSIIKLSNI
jgi:fructose-6-phosphate aldolase 2